MEEKNPITADDYKNQPHLAEPGEHVIIHGLVYRVLRHTWKPMKTGKKGRAVKGAERVPRDMVLRLLGIYAPQGVPQPVPACPPGTQPDPAIPEVVLNRDQNVTWDPGCDNTAGSSTDNVN